MIKIFNSNDKSFSSSNGEKILKPTYARVHKEDNGDFYLDIELGLEYLDYIDSNKIIVANTPQGEQGFRINSDIEKKKHKIKIKANHISYDSKNYIIQDSYVVDKNCNDALDHLNNATDIESPFETISDITKINSYRCVRKSLFEAFKEVLNRWGGHLVRDNFSIGIMDQIGNDNGVVVRYSKNLKDISVDYNWDDVVTKILPVGYDGITLDEVFLYSDIQYDIPYSKVIHFEQNIDDEDYRDSEGNLDETSYISAIKKDLREQAIEYLKDNSVPKVNYTLSANLEKITDVGDTIKVCDERIGIDILTNVISYDYDCILEKYIELEFGNFKKELSDLITSITSNTEKIVDNANTTLKVTLSSELKNATDSINSLLQDSNVINNGKELFICDTLPKENATYVMRINSSGIGFSNTGINGTFNSAWLIDGTLDMQQINVINLVADLIKGGTLKLGSNLNQNGQLEVYDEANNLIATLNKDGLRMNALDGGYIKINTEVGFAGYDKNDNKTYWVDGDEFHQKKSVIEEEITLVDKIRILPITIYNQNNEVVNDGAGVVASLSNLGG